MGNLSSTCNHPVCPVWYSRYYFPTNNKLTFLLGSCPSRKLLARCRIETSQPLYCCRFIMIFWVSKSNQITTWSHGQFVLHVQSSCLSSLMFTLLLPHNRQQINLPSRLVPFQQVISSVQMTSQTDRRQTWGNCQTMTWGNCQKKGEPWMQKNCCYIE